MDEVQILKERIERLEQIVLDGEYSSRKTFRKKVEMNNSVYIKDVDDISLTTIGDTSSSNQSSNITANFNKIIGALNNK